jgi:hypothetical protein
MAQDPLSHVASWITPTLDTEAGSTPANSSIERPATAEEAATIEFEPLGGPGAFDCFAIPAWNEECRDLGIILRFAGVLAQKTKPELVDYVRSVITDDGSGMDAFARHYQATQTAAERCEIFAKLLHAVNTRLVIATSTLELDFEREGDAA